MSLLRVAFVDRFKANVFVVADAPSELKEKRRRSTDPIISCMATLENRLRDDRHKITDCDDAENAVTMRK